MSDRLSFKSKASFFLSSAVISGLMNIGGLRSFLLDRIDETSADLRNLTINGLGRVLLGLNLPSRKQSLMALDSKVESIGATAANNFSMSFCCRVGLSVFGGDSSIP